MSQFLQFLRSFGLLIARLGVGGIMIMHGMTRWQGQGQGIQKQIDYLTQFGPRTRRSPPGARPSSNWSAACS